MGMKQRPSTDKLRTILKNLMAIFWFSITIDQRRIQRDSKVQKLHPRTGKILKISSFRLHRTGHLHAHDSLEGWTGCRSKQSSHPSFQADEGLHCRREPAVARECGNSWNRHADGAERKGPRGTFYWYQNKCMIILKRWKWWKTIIIKNIWKYLEKIDLV